MYEQTQTIEQYLELMLAPILTGQQKALRDAFVTEYLKDYDGIRACIRLGFQAGYAYEISNGFLDEPYVQEKLAKIEEERQDDAKSLENDRRTVLTVLKKEMLKQGPGSLQSARVQAAAHLGKLLGMDPAIKTQTEVTVGQTVQFYLPENGR